MPYLLSRRLTASAEATILGLYANPPSGERAAPIPDRHSASFTVMVEPTALIETTFIEAELRLMETWQDETRGRARPR